MRAWAAFLALAFALAGCAGDDGTGTGTTTTDDGSDTSSTTSGRSSTTTRSTTGTGTTSPGGNRDPSATLGVSVTSGAPPLAVNFTLGGVDPDGDALAWTLDFGDGSTADSGSTLPAEESHTFSAAGNFTVKFTVTDSKQAKAEKTQVIAVAAGAPAGPQVVEGEWTAGGPVSCEQFGLGDDLHQVLTPFEGVDFVTFDVTASTAGKPFAVAITATAPAAAFEIDFYDASGANLGYFQNEGPTAFSIAGEVPANSAHAVFFACTAGGGSFTYTAPA